MSKQQTKCKKLNKLLLSKQIENNLFKEKLTKTLNAKEYIHRNDHRNISIDDGMNCRQRYLHKRFGVTSWTKLKEYPDVKQAS